MNREAEVVIFIVGLGLSYTLQQIVSELRNLHGDLQKMQSKVNDRLQGIHNAVASIGNLLERSNQADNLRYPNIK